jgi:hypothetical protein
MRFALRTMPRSHTRIALWLLFFVVQGFDGWAWISTHRASALPYAQAASSDTDPTAATAALVLKCDCSLISDPIPSITGSDHGTAKDIEGALIDFFEQKETMNLFISAGGKRPCRVVPMTQDVQSLWETACDKYYGNDSKPCITTDVVMATDTELQFPGFKRITTVLNGCKLLRRHSSNDGVDNISDLPAYEFCLIGEKQRLTGSPPVVWLVRKLTGNYREDVKEGPDKDNEFQPSETSAKTRVCLIQQQASSKNTPKDSHAFQLDVHFRTTMQFPRLFLKLLPASQQNVEERGSQAISNVLQRDIDDALQGVLKAWVSQQDGL